MPYKPSNINTLILLVFYPCGIRSNLRTPRLPIVVRLRVEHRTSSTSFQIMNIVVQFNGSTWADVPLYRVAGLCH